MECLMIVSVGILGVIIAAYFFGPLGVVIFLVGYALLIWFLKWLNGDLG